MFYIDVMESALPGAIVFWGKASYGHVTGRPIMREYSDELYVPVRTKTGVDMLIEADTIWHITKMIEN